MARKYHLNSEEKYKIKIMYVQQLFSYREIALKLNLHCNAVGGYLRENNLFRTREEASRIARRLHKYPIHNSRFTGALIKDGRGYIQRYLERDDPYISMATKRNYILEHRYVMAKHLGRLLLRSEIVHHINGIPDDNRIENLELVSQANHNMVTKFCGNCSLRKDIRLIQFQNKELLIQVRKLTSIVMGLHEGKLCDAEVEV